jgi:hypothetical protein
VVSWGVPSEILIARPRAHSQPRTGIDRLIDPENDEEFGNEDR